MFNLSDEIIRSNSITTAIKRGQEYFERNRIKSVKFYQENMAFSAVVSGTEDYDVKIFFYDNGDIKGARCSCPANDQYFGYCKHIVAVLLLIREKDREGFFNKVKSKHIANQIFSFFEKRQAGIKIPVVLEATYEYGSGHYYGVGRYSSLSLKVGTDKLYTVKSIKNFLECVKDGKPMEFGKGFVYDPVVHEFTREDKLLIDFLTEYYEMEELSIKFSRYSNVSSVFKGKQVILAPMAVKRFFDIYNDKTFNAVINEKVFNNIKIQESDFPVNFHLTRDRNDLVLDIKLDGPVIPLSEDGEYFFAGGQIYKVSQKQRENFKPFYIAMINQKENKIRFSEEDKERFVSEVLPFAEKAGEVTIDEKLKEQIEKIELSCEIYLDRVEDMITADVRFIYGERVINPFSSSGGEGIEPEKILIRDVEKERTILDILGESDFKVNSGKISLDDSDRIFDFVYEILPKLQQYAHIFFTDGFKAMALRPSAVFKGKISLNNDTDMLEFSFDIEGIGQDELADVFNSIKERKRYYRLKNGTFLRLDTDDSIRMADIIEHLNIGQKEFEKKMIEIPKYRALYLDQKLKKAETEYFERNRAFKELVQNVKEPSDADIAVPEGLDKILRPYQKFGYKWLKTLSHYGLGGILADDMGLGKTLQVITLIEADKKEKGQKPSLIIVPTSLVYNWQSEVEKFAPDLNVVIITGGKDDRLENMQNIAEADLVITSYPLIRRDIDEYSKFDFRYCIIDEAQHIKNPESLNARSVKKIKSQRRFALTGTPIENSLSELWSIFDFVMPGYLFSHAKFVQKYEKPIIKDEDPKPVEELKKSIAPFILRRLKSEVLKELPEKIESKVVAELTQEQKKVYLAYLERIKAEIYAEIEEKGFEKSHIKILAGLTRLRQICCHPSVFLEGFKGESGKMLLLQEIVEDSIASGHRILLFSQFTSMLEIIRKWLDSQKIGYMYLDGSTPAKERGVMVKAFNEGRGSVFLISLKAGGTGLNLTGADTVIHYDPWWNPAVEDQATDRAYRIGQENRVHVMKLITKGTIEEKIYNLQEKKKKLIDAVIQPGETLISKMSEEEVRALFEA